MGREGFWGGTARQLTCSGGKEGLSEVAQWQTRHGHHAHKSFRLRTVFVAIIQPLDRHVLIFCRALARKCALFVQWPDHDYVIPVNGVLRVPRVVGIWRRGLAPALARRFGELRQAWP